MVQKNTTPTKAQLAAARLLPVKYDTPIRDVAGNPALRLGLRSSPKLKEVIDGIIKLHRARLYEAHPLVELQGARGSRTLIDSGAHWITVKHFYPRRACLLDCEYFFYVDDNQDWYAVAQEVKLEGYSQVVKVYQGGIPYEVADSDMQGIFAGYADWLGERLIEEGWPNAGKVLVTWREKVGVR